MTTAAVAGLDRAVSPAVERIAALRRAGFSPGVQQVLAVEGDLCPERLQTAFEQVVARHAPLGTAGWTHADVTAIPLSARRETSERRLHDERRAMRVASGARALLLSW